MRRARKCVALVFFVSSAASPTGVVTAFPPESEPLPWKDAMKVHELLHLDTAEAIRLAHDRQRLMARQQERSDLSPLPQLAHDVLSLQAIYGVGKHLYAEVVHRGRTMVFAKGLVQPIGVSDGNAVYRLEGIAGRCVRLEVDGAGHTLCLPHKKGMQP
jgi:hypothetical protein